jgi:hypothetical protein
MEKRIRRVSEKMVIKRRELDKWDYLFFCLILKIGEKIKCVGKLENG